MSHRSFSSFSFIRFSFIIYEVKCNMCNAMIKLCLETLNKNVYIEIAIDWNKKIKTISYFNKMNKYLIILYHTHNARHILANIILDSKIETSSRATVHSYLLNTVGLGIGTSSPINDRAHAYTPGRPGSSHPSPSIESNAITSNYRTTCPCLLPF